MKKKGLGKNLENHFSSLISGLFPGSYWPSRSGLQNGYDAYAKFNFDSMDYWWKFELKDLNAKKHNKKFSDIKEIEIRDFSDKVLQLMARVDRDVFPYILCVVMPHKKIGNNNQFRDDLESWNIFNKFPFKIVIWDFDFLAPRLARYHPSWHKTFYPSAPATYKRNSIQVGPLIEDIKNESRDGCLFNRSYVTIRERKISSEYGRAMRVRIEMAQSKADHVEFKLNGESIAYPLRELEKLCVKKLPQSNLIPASMVKGEIYDESEGAPPSDPQLPDTSSGYNELAHRKDIDSKKKGLIALFKAFKFGRHLLFDLIKNFCTANNEGSVTFVIPKNITLARIPFKELQPSDFETSNDIDFCIGYIKDE